MFDDHTIINIIFVILSTYITVVLIQACFIINQLIVDSHTYMSNYIPGDLIVNPYDTQRSHAATIIQRRYRRGRRRHNATWQRISFQGHHPKPS